MASRRDSVLSSLSGFSTASAKSKLLVATQTPFRRLSVRIRGFASSTFGRNSAGDEQHESTRSAEKERRKSRAETDTVYDKIYRKYPMASMSGR